MPFLHVDGVRLYYRLQGRDDRPVVMFAHSLGLDHGQWDAQAIDLLPHFRVLRYDIRGHGASDAPDGDYSIERLGRDALAIADALDIQQFAFCGLSLGGMIGQWLCAMAPDRLTRAVLANTSARWVDPGLMEARRTTALKNGMGSVVDSVLQRCFRDETLSGNPALVATIRRTILSTNPVGYAGCCAAIRDLDNTGLLSSVTQPVLIVSGDRDVSTPWAGNGDVLAAMIPGSKTRQLPAAHLSNLERPRSFSGALLDFLIQSPDGMETRRSVLGDDHVDRALAQSNDFNREFQDWITRYAWGIWSRPGLDHRTRRLLALSVTAALGRWDEFRLHVRTGLRHELEPFDLKEVLLQTAIYAGVPVGNTGFRIAQEEIDSPT